MSDDEKQLDNPLPQTDEPMVVEIDNGGVASATTRLDSEVATNIESEPPGDESTPTAATEVAGTDPEEMLESETTSPADADIAILETLQQENQLLKNQLEELNQQFESLKTQSMRMAADFDNFRKRTAKEKEDSEHLIKGNTLKELLPIVDNFDRARSQIKPQNDGEMSIHKSYQGVYKQLVDCLKRIGVSPMRAEGQEFDPNLHEAVMREATDEYPEGVVIEQLMRGYFLGEKVLRHAMVKVAAAPTPVVASEDEAAETTNN